MHGRAAHAAAAPSTLCCLPLLFCTGPCSHLPPTTTEFLNLKILPLFCLPLIEQQPPCSPATSTGTALCSITNTKMAHFTFPSQVSPMYFYAHPSSLTATRYLFPFNSCLASLMPSEQCWKGHSCKVPEHRQEQQRGFMSHITSQSWHLWLPAQGASEQQLLHRPPAAPVQWLFEFSMRNYLSFDWFTTRIHYCPLLQNSARLRCLPSPPITRQPHLPYH